jgi:hypothetical protein
MTSRLNNGRIPTFALILCAISLLVSGCGTGQNGAVDSADLPPVQQAEILFQVNLPADVVPLPNEPNNPSGIAIEIVDEVTGLAFNTTHYIMQSADLRNYYYRLAVPVGSFITYRYIRLGSPSAVEYSSNNEQIRYRVVPVTGPTVINDKVAAWIDTTYSSQVGRVTGQIIRSDNNVPIPSIMVNVSGMTTLTASDGTFVIENVPVGQHVLVAYSLDGSYSPFTQGLVVADAAATPAVFNMQPATLINVTFIVRPPQDTPENAELRLIGNLLQFGNTFTDLNAGLSVLSSRAPIMTRQSDGSYFYTVQLPAGTDLHYKYTLGDGFWNAEHSALGAFILHEFIIPTADVLIEDTIESWSGGTNAPVTITLAADPTLPAGETVSIAFNPYAWTNPIPMWSDGSGGWTYTLFSPLDILATVQYQFCRNGQCAVAAGIPTSATSMPSFTASPEPQIINNSGMNWIWNPVSQASGSVIQINPREQGFVTGVALWPANDPGIQPQYNTTFQQIQSLGANLVIVSPTWTVSNSSLPRFEIDLNRDATWSDSVQQVHTAQNNGLAVVVYPRIHYPTTTEQWWQSAQSTDSFWQTWFDRYRVFILTYADLAAQTNASALVLGGNDIYAALPGNPNSSLIMPSNMSERWSNLISEVRQHYSGPVIWSIPFNNSSSFIPSWIGQFDLILLELEAPVTINSAQTVQDYSDYLAGFIQSSIIPLQQQLNRQLLIGIRYPSTDGASNGCTTTQNGCFPFDQINFPGVDIEGVSMDLSEQADIYTAVIAQFSQQAWVQGIISLDYYPSVSLSDESTSVRGKPAEQILNLYFHTLISIAQ